MLLPHKQCFNTVWKCTAAKCARSIISVYKIENKVKGIKVQMRYPREYRAVRINEHLEWMVLDIHVFLIIFYNLRDSFHFWNDTTLSCPPNWFVSSQMKDKHVTILNTFISQSTKKPSMNDWLNEVRLNVVHMQQKTYFFEITRHFWNASLYFQLRWCLTLAWYEMKKIVKNRQTKMLQTRNTKSRNQTCNH